MTTNNQDQEYPPEEPRERELNLIDSKDRSFEDQVLLNQQAIGVLSNSTNRKKQFEREPALLRRQSSRRQTNFGRESPENPYIADLISSISVAFVNLPMCMAFASAARLTPTSGIISCFWSSLFIGFSDSKYSIISVAMGVALLTGPMVTSYGEDGYHISLFLSGLIIMMLLFTRLYKYMIIIPKSVMDGFMAGCVLGVFNEQIPTIFMIGKHERKEGAEEGNLVSNLFRGISNVIAERHNVNLTSTFLYFFITITLFLLMKKYPSKPWVLFTCLFGIIIGYLEDYMGKAYLLRLSEQYPDLSLRFFHFPSIGSRNIRNMLSKGQFY